MADGPQQIEFIVADLNRYAGRELIALGLNVDANLRANPPLGTPVDTGWAAANWVPSVGAPKVLPNADHKDPTPAMLSAAFAAGQAGLNELLAYQIDDGAIFVSNGVPYIIPLNEGHSTQSPPGFVQAALAQAVEETLATAAQRPQDGGGGLPG